MTNPSYIDNENITLENILPKKRNNMTTRTKIKKWKKYKKKFAKSKQDNQASQSLQVW